MSVVGYRDLKVWQASMDLVESVYEATGKFPPSERYVLANQIQRSVVSIPSNLAEGHARSSRRDYRRYVAIGRGSLAELETQLMIASRLRYIDSVALDKLLDRSEAIGKMLRGLQVALERAEDAIAPSILDPRASIRPSNA